MSFTPGPWSLSECSNGGLLLGRPPLEGQKHAIQSHLQILPTADAHLIAAAPDLYEACKLALTFTREGCPDPDCRVCKQHAAEMDQIRAAIQKADGL